MTPDSTIVRIDREGYSILQLQCKAMNWANHAELREAFAAMKGQPIRAVVVDFSSVEDMDSVALGSLFSGRIQLRRQAEIIFCHINDRVSHLLRHTQIDKVFSIHGDLPSAEKAAQEIARQADR
ncbi:MAG: STAS domain protein [candidate division BRC1 bacterium ADurb.BinA364]|nr:MAG: STAS domain protein [candidate division BRC1 bacterium ADurb.BinA364]